MVFLYSTTLKFVQEVLVKSMLSPSRENMVNFGGNPDPASGDRRVSRRIQDQTDADDLQMRRAMRAANLRDIESNTGYLQGVCLDPYVVITEQCGGQGAFGYWVQPMGDGCTGYLQPVWMTVC